ncbi:hypothetical protein EYC98_13175 [Halieaceae bacterium IMCC14734]|uniref:Uncharacterized protein n=1 Tax=Candidatus Litorirhabdus singularis TaxID=2518993 RepID=A0ABT3TJ68_9GAMM|nr:hypothetical protein [Candidatus Litorirhabdus singularis]MCX2981811.1 hypothetical protein [Candidatus Litorirhabdus singularis]
MELLENWHAALLSATMPRSGIAILGLFFCAVLRIPAQREHPFRVEREHFSSFSGMGVHLPGITAHVQPESFLTH